MRCNHHNDFFLTLTQQIQHLSENSLRHPVFVDAADSEEIQEDTNELVTPST